MKLILKQPQNKPPCICICFKREYDASLLNKEWIHEHNKHLYGLIFEINEGKLDVIIKNEELGLKHTYRDVAFFPDKLSRFLYDNKGASVYSFCHITSYMDKDRVAMVPLSGQKHWVLKIESIQVKREM